MRTKLFHSTPKHTNSSFQQTVRNYRALVFWMAFALFSINSHIASQMPDNEMAAKKWAAAYRSLERALNTTITAYNFLDAELLKK